MILINVPGYAVVEAKDLPPGSILISIQEEYGPPPRISHVTAPTLVVKFSDIQEELEEDGSEVLHPITPGQAEEILEFVEANAQAAMCVVHCAGGVSRSAAVVMALHVIHGWPLPKTFWQVSTPNPCVIGAIILSAERKLPLTGIDNQMSAARAWGATV